MDKTAVPPQIVVLAIIARNSDGVTLKDIVADMNRLCRSHKVPASYYPCGGVNGVLRELLLDVNTLKVMGLVRESNGKYIATEKGYNVLKRFSESSSTVKSILSPRS